MSLLLCPDCQRQVSSTAAACPQCGWTNESALRDRSRASVKRLLALSRQFALLGTLLALIGTYATCRADKALDLEFWAGSVSPGFAFLLVSAVIGQIARGRQGRIV